MMMNTVRPVFLAATALTLILAAHPAPGGAPANVPPVADAGLIRYAAADPVQLDGTGSYDPDASGALRYEWHQVSGPHVVMQGADTPQPVISGPVRMQYGYEINTFIQTDEIQICEFELVVGDGVAESRPDRVQVVIVPDFGENMFVLANGSFDPRKPTVISFGGGDCNAGYPTGSGPTKEIQLARYNAINFPNGFRPDRNGWRSFLQIGDMIIVYLSTVAPTYDQAIQTAGFSTGGQAAVDVGRRLNLTYRDARYAVNHVVLYDAASYCRDYTDSIAEFIAGSVDGEQCWLENLVCSDGGRPAFHPGVLTVELEFDNHLFPSRWYERSETTADSPINAFNGGVVAGAFLGVAGPGRNLQLAFTPQEQVYRFQWCGTDFVGHMEMKDESLYPGRLPEPVTLLGPDDGAAVDSDGALLSCKPSQNAVGYELLFGADPRHMVYLYSDTPTPPREVVSAFPFAQTWWTIRARDAFGTTIHSDPRLLHAALRQPQPIESAATGQRYPSIQAAVNDALDGDTILITPGLPCLESIDFKGKTIALRSTDPNIPAIVNGTMIAG